MDTPPGPATNLSVIVKAPTTQHQLTLAELESWLSSNGRSPSEQSMKIGLRNLLNR